MTIALIDNGSLEATAHLNLRRVAAEMSERVGVVVHPVSWRHSDRIPSVAPGEITPAILPTWIRARVARGERSFVFVPFFISPQGAIASVLHADLTGLQQELGGFDFEFTEGLAAHDAIVRIVAALICETIADRGLQPPAAIIVDHGGPSPASAELRDKLTEKIRARLGTSVSRLAAASMEGETHAHNRPLLADQLEGPGYNSDNVVIAPLFLSPGRHAGIQGDLVQIARAAEDRSSAALKCHFTGLVGTHPLAVEALVRTLGEAPVMKKGGRAAYP